MAWCGQCRTRSDPALIDLRLREDADEATLARLQTLADEAPAARIDAQAQWLSPVLSALSALGWMALALIGLLAFTGAAAVWLAARNALGSNRDTIEIVHLLGGNDAQIARIFQRSILADAAGLGLVPACWRSGCWVRSLLRWIRGWSREDRNRRLAGLGPCPAGAVALAVLTARFTVLASLRKML